MSETQSPLTRKKLPVALLVMAIIGTIYAASGLAGSVQSAIMAPVMALMNSLTSGTYRSFDSASMPPFPDIYGNLVPILLLLAGISLPVYLVGLISCVGALKRKPRSGTGMTAFAVLLYAHAVASTLILFFMMNPLLETMEGAFGPSFAMTGFSSFWSIYFAVIRVVIVVSLPLGCVLPTIMLVVLNKPAVKDHYRELRSGAA